MKFLGIKNVKILPFDAQFSLFPPDHHKSFSLKNIHSWKYFNLTFLMTFFYLNKTFVLHPVREKLSV